MAEGMKKAFHHARQLTARYGMPCGLAALALWGAVCLILLFDGFVSAITSEPAGLVLFAMTVAAAGMASVAGLMRPDVFRNTIHLPLRRLPKPVLWLCAALFALLMFRLGFVLAQKSAATPLVMVFYLWVIAATLLVIAWREDGNPPALQTVNPTAMTHRSMLKIAALFFALAILRDALLVVGFSYTAGRADSAHYLRAGRDMAALTWSDERGNTYYTLAYPLLIALTGAAYDPLALVWLQILLGGAAIAALVYVIGKHNLPLAIGSGVFLLLDLVWGSNNRIIMTEGVTTSLSLLSLALLDKHFERSKGLRGGELVAAGLLYGFTFTIRPSNLPLAVLMPLVYWLLTRSWRKGVWVSVGIGIVLLLHGGANVWRKGTFALVDEPGLYAAWPLFHYGLFSPDNGPVSRQLDAELRGCAPDVDYLSLTAGVGETSKFMFTTAIPCLGPGYLTEELSARFGAAYVEAIKAHPLDFALKVAQNNSLFLASPASLGLQSNLLPSDCDLFFWCADRQTQLLDPQSGPGKALIDAITPGAAALFQPYLLLLPQTPIDFNGLAAWLLMAGFLVIVTNRKSRLLIIACIGMVLYVSVSVVAGHVFIVRYTTPLSPYYGLLSATLVVTVAQAVFAALPFAQPRIYISSAAFQKIAAGAVAAGVLAFIGCVIFVQWAAPRRVPAAGPPAGSAIVGESFDGIVELMGFGPLQSNHTPGSRLSVPVYWRAIANTAEDYKVSLQLLDPQGNRIASSDVTLGSASPTEVGTSHWPLGRMVAETYPVRIPKDSPPVLRVIVIVYHKGSFEPLHLDVSPGTPSDLTRLRLTGLGLITQQGIPELQGNVTEAHFTLADSLIITGVKLPDHVSPGKALQIGLRLAVTQPFTQDYTIFFHLTDSQGNLMAQSDSQALEGDWTTSALIPDHTLGMTHSLYVPATLPPGRYRLQMGAYVFPSLDRLTARDSAGKQLANDLIDLGWISIP